MATQAERRANTRKVIIGSAHEHFVKDGYNKTSVSDILETADVSRGAMYHHFASKAEVFAAVFVQTSNAAIRAAAEHVDPDATPHDALLSGCLAWLDVVSDPKIGRLLFTEGPIALGWQRCRALEEATSLGVVRASVTAAVNAGQIEIGSVDLTARLINALLSEAALIQSSGASPSRAEVAAGVTAMINGLRR